MCKDSNGLSVVGFDECTASRHQESGFCPVAVGHQAASVVHLLPYLLCELLAYVLLRPSKAIADHHCPLGFCWLPHPSRWCRCADDHASAGRRHAPQDLQARVHHAYDKVCPHRSFVFSRLNEMNRYYQLIPNVDLLVVLCESSSKAAGEQHLSRAAVLVYSILQPIICGLALVAFALYHMSFKVRLDALPKSMAEGYFSTSTSTSSRKTRFRRRTAPTSAWP